MSESTEDRHARQRIRREWEAAGRPPCPVCQTALDSEARGRVSLLWRAVVHPFCAYARVTGQSPNGLLHDPCPLYPDCPIPFESANGHFCACPRYSAVNMIILARRFKQPTIKVPTGFSPAAQRAARAAGLYKQYHGVPMLEFPRYDLMRRYGTLAQGLDQSFFEQPTDLDEPPEYLTVDVDQTIREGKIIALIGGPAFRDRSEHILPPPGRSISERPAPAERLRAPGRRFSLARTR